MTTEPNRPGIYPLHKLLEQVLGPDTLEKQLARVEEENRDNERRHEALERLHRAEDSLYRDGS